MRHIMSKDRIKCRNKAKIKPTARFGPLYMMVTFHGGFSRSDAHSAHRLRRSWRWKGREQGSLQQILATACLSLRRAARAGFYECDMAVQVGRPSNKAEIIGMIRRYDRVKAVGIGHRWTL